jgi:putative YphP/YqiW family bacilliredoxin
MKDEAKRSTFHPSAFILHPSFPDIIPTKEGKMPYPEIMIRPMREDLTRLGVEELRTADAVDETVANTSGTLMVIVNSICGCAAGKARPGVALALQHQNKPDKVTTVFAGADVEATERARSYFKGYGPSSPSIALLRNGELVYMLERYQIEGRDATQIAGELTKAFDEFCG